MRLKEAFTDRANVLLYGSKGNLVGCIGQGIERAVVEKSDLVRGTITIQPEGSSATPDLKGHLIKEPIMPQIS